MTTEKIKSKRGRPKGSKIIKKTDEDEPTELLPNVDQVEIALVPCVDDPPVFTKKRY